MTVNVTIIGLGHIGGSIGLALADHKDQVSTTGHDKLPEIAKEAARLGAVEKVSFNLPASVIGADVIILALPLDQLEQTLKFISLDVRQDAVILDTAPAKVQTAEWVRKILPPRRHYVGLTPALNPSVLEDSSRGLASARTDLFAKSFIGVSTPPGTAEEALKLAANLVTLLGAEPYFIDPAEADGIMASAHFLPAFTAAALAEASLSQPGWGDIRKLSGKSMAAVLRLFEIEEPSALAAMALLNRADSLRVLDGCIASLQSLRAEVAREGENSLKERLEQTGLELEQWWLNRRQGDWKPVELARQELPTLKDILKQQVGGLDKLFNRGKKPEPPRQD